MLTGRHATLPALRLVCGAVACSCPQPIIDCYSLHLWQTCKLCPSYLDSMALLRVVSVEKNIMELIWCSLTNNNKLWHFWLCRLAWEEVPFSQYSGEKFKKVVNTLANTIVQIHVLKSINLKSAWDQLLQFIQIFTWDKLIVQSHK